MYGKGRRSDGSGARTTGHTPAADARLEHLVRQGAGWRQKARTAPQEALARKLGITIDQDWAAGQLSDAITAVTGEWYD